MMMMMMMRMVMTTRERGDHVEDARKEPVSQKDPRLTMA